MRMYVQALPKVLNASGGCQDLVYQSRLNLMQGIARCLLNGCRAWVGRVSIATRLDEERNNTYRS